MYDILHKCNNTHYITIKMKPSDVKSNIPFGSSKEINNKNPKFEITYIVKISKLKNIIAKGYTPSWSEEFLMIKKS